MFATDAKNFTKKVCECKAFWRKIFPHSCC